MTEAAAFPQPPDTGPEGSLPHSLAQRRIVRFDPGHAVIEYEVLPAICHSGGVAQGGFVAGWIDAAQLERLAAPLSKNWKSIHHWKPALQSFQVMFEDRVPLGAL